MHDIRFDKLAQLLVEYSTRLKRNETVLIEAFDVPDEMTVALIRAARKAGAIPFTQIQHGRVTRDLAMNATERQLNLTAIHELARMKKMDAYIGLRGSKNITELSDVPAEQMKLVARKMRPVRDQRVTMHARQLRAHVDILAARRYPTAFRPAAPFTVLFVPSDGFLTTALEAEPGTPDRTICPSGFRV